MSRRCVDLVRGVVGSRICLVRSGVVLVQGIAALVLRLPSETIVVHRVTTLGRNDFAVLRWDQSGCGEEADGDQLWYGLEDVEEQFIFLSGGVVHGDDQVHFSDEEDQTDEEENMGGVLLADRLLGLVFALV